MWTRRWLSRRAASRTTLLPRLRPLYMPCRHHSNDGRNSDSADANVATAVAAAATSAAASNGRGNYFAFFDLPEQPDVDGRVLQKRYHDLQRRVHPDQENVRAAEQREHTNTNNNSSSSSKAEGDDGANNNDNNDNNDDDSDNTANEAAATAAVSSYANGAYETLRDAFERCSYLSRLVRARAAHPLRTLSAAEEEQLCVVDDERELHGRARVSDAAPSEAFLAEMVAMNELVFCGDRDDDDVRARLRVLHVDLCEREADYYDRAQAAWRAGDMDAFHALVVEWRFVHNVLRHLRDRL